MPSNGGKCRLWSQPNEPIIPIRRRRQLGLFDTFGRYGVIRAKYNAANPNVEAYHYINTTGWYTSINPDGSQEKLHVKKKTAYLPPYSGTWEDCSGEVDWDTLPEIPDLCIATGSRPTPWIWEEIKRLEQEEGMVGSSVACGIANATKPQLKQPNDNMTNGLQTTSGITDRKLSNEGRMSNVNEDVMSESASETSTSQDELTEDKLPRKKKSSVNKVSTQLVLAIDAKETAASNASEDENEAAKHTGVKSKSRQRKIEKPEKEQKEHKKQRKQKKAESKQGGEEKSPRARKMGTVEEEPEKRQFEEQESKEKAEEMKLAKKLAKKQKKQRKLEAKLKEESCRKDSAALSSRKRKADNEDEVTTTSRQHRRNSIGLRGVIR
ncbi:uncharacterized protein N7518_001405 [Penicillium psychrosexuale]|uniref:uncharacterized protein n=1 Tax=Penicillium psychrosexuale TaxID=1002107 RepID=UPI0025458AE7|nr:uncharacterized protein N7518_001405 [Penicillium psychrosexuale]KAJ5799337.1 hypothetical protein N7518_001405 [Penicillium psychrosexuale]